MKENKTREFFELMISRIRTVRNIPMRMKRLVVKFGTTNVV